MATPEKVYKAGIVREAGYLYYFDNSNIMRTTMLRGGMKRKPGDKPEIIRHTSIAREKGYIYFLDQQGDISRYPASGHGVTRKKIAKKVASRKKQMVIDRYLECKTNRSNKFWHMRWDGKLTYITTWGKIGTMGTTNSKSFVSSGLCKDAVEKAVLQKLAKGYKEIHKSVKTPDQIIPEAPAPSALDIFD